MDLEIGVPAPLSAYTFGISTESTSFIVIFSLPVKSSGDFAEEEELGGVEPSAEVAISAYIMGFRRIPTQPLNDGCGVPRILINLSLISAGFG